MPPSDKMHPPLERVLINLEASSDLLGYLIDVKGNERLETAIKVIDLAIDLVKKEYFKE